MQQIEVKSYPPHMSTPFQTPKAFWPRVGSNLIDGLVFIVPSLLFGGIIAAAGGNDNLVRGLFNLLSSVYQIMLPVYWNGQTLGKRAINARIVRVDGGLISWWTMIKRVYLSGLVYAVTLGIGVIVSAIMIGVREDKRGIHDLIAGTQVVED